MPRDCWHDSTLANASGMYDELDAIFYAHPGGAQVVVDSALSKDNCPPLVKSHQNIMDRFGNIRESENQFCDAPSIRQMSEWGIMGAAGLVSTIKRPPHL